MKQLARVLDVLQEGPATSLEIAAETGLPKAHVSAYLSELEGSGAVKKTGRLKCVGKRNAVQYAHIYALKA